MKGLYKIILTVIMGMMFFAFFGGLVMAANGGLTFGNPLADDDIVSILNKIWKFIYILGLSLVPLMAIIAGFMFLTAGGQTEKIKKAREILLYGAIGFVVVLLANGIVGWIGNILGVKPEVAEEMNIKQFDSISQEPFSAKDFMPIGDEAVPPPPPAE